MSPGVRRIPAPMVPPIPMARPKASPRTRRSFPDCGAAGLAMATPQLLERPLHVHAGHLLPPRQVEIGVVHRLGGPEGRVRPPGNRLILEGRAHERRPRFGDLL